MVSLCFDLYRDSLPGLAGHHGTHFGLHRDGVFIWFNHLEKSPFHPGTKGTSERKHTNEKRNGEANSPSSPGLASFIGMHCDLYITRQDQLIVEDAISARIIPPAELSRIGLFYGSIFDYLSDVDLARALKFQTIPRFNHVRAWIRRNPTARRRLIVAVMFENPINELEYSEMAVFSDIDQKGESQCFCHTAGNRGETRRTPQTAVRKIER